MLDALRRKNKRKTLGFCAFGAKREYPNSVLGGTVNVEMVKLDADREAVGDRAPHRGGALDDRLAPLVQVPQLAQDGRVTFQRHRAPRERIARLARLGGAGPGCHQQDACQHLSGAAAIHPG